MVNIFKRAKKELEGELEEQLPKLKSIAVCTLFRFTSKKDKIFIGIGVLCAIAAAFVVPVHMKVFGVLSGEMVRFGSTLVVEHNDAALNKARERFHDAVWIYVYQMIILGCTMLLFMYIAISCFIMSQINQIFRIRAYYFYSLLRQDPSWYDDVHKTSNFTTAMSEDMIKLEDGIGEKCPLLIFQFTVATSCLILAFITGWKLTLISISVLPIVVVIFVCSGKVISKYAKKESETYATAGTIAEETLSLVRTVVSYGGQQREVDRYEKELRTAEKQNIFRNSLTGLSYGLLLLCIFAGFSLNFWVGVKFILKDRDVPEGEQTYTSTVVVTIFFSILMTLFNFSNFIIMYEYVNKARGAAPSIYAVIDSAPVINQSKGKGDIIPGPKGEIVFKDVYFQYPSRSEVQILNGLNLTIEPGKTVALVGESGSGKTTILQLILRFYDPIEGQILFDGRDIRDFDLVWYRSNFGMVGQEPVLFTATIYNNIRFGNLNATRKEVELAARRANADRFIRTLPEGYFTVVGGKSPNLSGGQKQRIAIARTLVRNPSILLLDEATSALDDKSEYLIHRALEELREACTTVIVAHKMSTVKNADVIVFIADGAVAEQGSHTELMDLKGLYYNSVTTHGLGVEEEEDDEEGPYDRKISEESEGFDSRENVAVSIDESEDDVKMTLCQAMGKIIKLNGPEWLPLTLGCVSSMLVGAMWPGVALFLGLMLELLSDPDEDHVREHSNFYSGLLVLIGILTCIAYFLQYFMFGYSGEKLVRRLRPRLFSAILKQEMAWFDDEQNSVGALCVRLSEEAALVQMAIGYPIGTVLQATSMMCLSLFFALYLVWKLGLVVMGLISFIIVAFYFNEKLSRGDLTLKKRSFKKSTNLAIETISNIKTVSSLNCEEFFFYLYVRELQPQKRSKMIKGHIRGLTYGFAKSSIFGVAAISAAYGGYLILNEDVPYASVFKVTQILLVSTDCMANALVYIAILRRGMRTAISLFKLMERVPKIRNADDPNDIKPWKNGDIGYNDVYLVYPTRHYQALRMFDLKIEAGTTVALVGPSGCGKSSIFRLLLRFYDPTFGSVTVNGTDVREIDLDELRKHMGVVSQEPALFNRTIAENIAYGDNSRVVDMQEIVDAAISANIHNFIVSLPKGYDTSLGRSSSTQLSGGQKQRIAIARALVRNPQVLLLDEATSALDTESEKVVQEALEVARVGRTCITIAHRLSTIRDADVICVVKKGVIVESGTHSELVAAKGAYYKMLGVREH